MLKLIQNGFRDLDINLLCLVKSVKTVLNSSNSFLKEFADNVFGGGVQRYNNWAKANQANFTKAGVEASSYMRHVKMFTLQ